MGIRGEIFSTRSGSKSERRTYFFNVKENRNGDIFLNVVESKKHGETDFERHQIVVFQEDLQEFLQALGKAVEAVRSGEPKRTNPPAFGRPYPAGGTSAPAHTGENFSGGFHRGPASE
ncbi:MAG: PUR family DNA/RNA-binding protein [Spirochaetales bacterium]|nr:PUR family DNA/RNA-binding protein [Spirochaetales bacterium]